MRGPPEPKMRNRPAANGTANRRAEFWYAKLSKGNDLGVSSPIAAPADRGRIQAPASASINSKEANVTNSRPPATGITTEAEAALRNGAESRT